MRVAFGLVSLLVVVGLLLLFFSELQYPALKKGVETREQARQIAGRDETGAAATESITLDLHQRGGKTDGAVVTAVTPGGAMQTLYGLQPGDVIVQAGDMPFGEPFVTDADMAEAMLLEAYKADRPLQVLRNGQRIELPQPAGAPTLPQPAPQQPSAPTQTPDPAPAPQPQQPKKPGGLEGQLDIIRNLPGQQ